MVSLCPNCKHKIYCYNQIFNVKLECCTICCEENLIDNLIILLPCGHVFCNNCIFNSNLQKYKIINFKIYIYKLNKKIYNFKKIINNLLDNTQIENVSINTNLLDVEIDNNYNENDNLLLNNFDEYSICNLLYNRCFMSSFYLLKLLIIIFIIVFFIFIYKS